METLVTQKVAAQVLGISTATVTNWIRHGYIQKEHNLINLSELKELQKKITNGEIDRLNKRANKSHSKHKFIPEEYVSSQESIDKIEDLIDFIITHCIKIDQAIFLLAINLFIRNHDILTSDLSRIFAFSKNDYKRKGVFNFISNWFSEISSVCSNYRNSNVEYLINCDLPHEKDILGIIYQSIIHEGEKSNLGSYYTPKSVVDSVLSNNLRSGSKVLDPCCGTGQFLLAFAEKVKNPVNVYGFDIDKRAVHIAQCNILLFYKELDFAPNVFYLNSLLLNNRSDLFSQTSHNFTNFDFIATNPPWGAKYKNAVLSKIKSNFPEIRSKESFSFFICQSYNMLKQGGKMCFVLPESITNVKTHQDIRNFIIYNFTIERLYILGRCFKNVLSPVITLDMKNNLSEDNDFTVYNDKEQYKIRQSRFLKNKYCLFDIYINNLDVDIFKKLIKKEHVTLKNKADWALGIVTGDNKKFINNTLQEGFEAIYKGADVKPFILKSPENFIRFIPDNFQQVAPVYKYRAEKKLIYKFISKNLVFAYDNKQSLTLNSANILIPKISDYHMKLILGFLNSDLFNFYFQKKFNSIKILRSDLEQLPFPILTQEQIKKMLSIIDSILLKKSDIKLLNDFVYQLFKISRSEIEYINTYLRK